MGSVGLASITAHVAFVVLLVYGWATDELGSVAIAVCVTLWLAGWLLLDEWRLFSPAIAVVDIALVLAIFRSDVRLR